MPEPALDRAKLVALLQTLLPGNDDWPSAGELDLAEAVTARLDMAAGHAEALAELLEALPAEFVDASVEEREGLLRSHETTPEFGVALVVAYDAYYVQKQVLALLEERCGYVTRPPQPDGFELPPFDESRLEKQRQREPFWRKA